MPRGRKPSGAAPTPTSSSRPPSGTATTRHATLTSTKYPQGWLNDERYADEADSASALAPRYSNSPWEN